MGITVELSAVTKSFLDEVSLVRQSCGYGPVSTLTGADAETQRAMKAVREALEEVWYRKKWLFRQKFMPINLQDKTCWYQFPDDFGEMDNKGINHTLASEPLPYVPYERLISEVPDFIHYPPDAYYGLSMTIEAANKVSHYGDPYCFTISRGYIGFWLIPNAAFIAAVPMLLVSYYTRCPDLVEDGDVIGLPKNIWGSFDSLAIAYFKQSMEHKDYAADENRGERRLGRATAREEMERGVENFDHVPDWMS